jgi:hypothetical protein
VKTQDACLFRELAEDHADLLARLKRVQGSAPGFLTARLFGQLRRELLAHGKGEAEVVYSSLPVGPEETTEHARIDRLLAELDPFHLSTDRWRAGLDDLVQSFAEHVEHEEDDLFARARASVTRAQASNMEARFRLARARELRRLEGHGVPQRATFSRVAVGHGVSSG